MVECYLLLGVVVVSGTSGVTWVDYILSDTTRSAEVEGWAPSGHEISSHRHSIHHGWPDGYTDYGEEAYSDALEGREGECSYQGTVAEWTAELQRLNSDLSSGCSNDADDKSSIPVAATSETRSLTLSEAIERGILPERRMASEQLLERP